MDEYTILVPQFLNDGSVIADSQFAELERRFLDEFGGYSNLGLLRGAWRNDDGVTFFDTNMRYSIATNDHDKIERIAKEIADKWQQEAIYVAKSATNVEFVTIAA